MDKSSLELEELARERSEIYQIFSNEKRVLIFWHLAKKEMAVHEIAEAIDSSIQNVSQHLRLMKARDILVSHRNGQSTLYKVADSEVGRYCLKIHDLNDDVIDQPELDL